LAFSSSSLSVQPPPLTGGVPADPVGLIGPFQPSAIAAAIKPPFGGTDASMPGGGSIVRLTQGEGFGGTLQIPLGVVEVDAAALLERLPVGTHSFLAVLGVSFTLPILLSLG